MYAWLPWWDSIGPGVFSDPNCKVFFVLFCFYCVSWPCQLSKKHKFLRPMARKSRTWIISRKRSPWWRYMCSCHRWCSWSWSHSALCHFNNLVLYHLEHIEWPHSLTEKPGSDCSQGEFGVWSRCCVEHEWMSGRCGNFECIWTAPVWTRRRRYQGATAPWDVILIRSCIADHSGLCHSQDKRWTWAEGGRLLESMSVFLNSVCGVAAHLHSEFLCLEAMSGKGKRNSSTL